MGMLVDVRSMQNAVVFGLIVSGLAVLSKALGSGLPAWVSGFNLRGSARIGTGMIPRGEVALIIAGIGLSQGIIGQDLFGVSIIMTVITTALAPVVLIPCSVAAAAGCGAPRGAPGKRPPNREDRASQPAPTTGWTRETLSRLEDSRSAFARVTFLRRNGGLGAGFH